MLRVSLIVGSKSARFCGVKDYSERLGTELCTVGVEADVLAPADWTIAGFVQLCKAVQKSNSHIVHVQYPSIGFRSSLLPHFLGRSLSPRKSVVTIHEFSALPLLQRFSMNVFRWTTDQIMFVSQFERDAYHQACWYSGASLTIPIGSNIPVYSRSCERGLSIIYFGQIRPTKGIEDFLALARLSSDRSLPFRFVLAGSAPTKHEEYLQSLRSQAPLLVEWRTDAPTSEVSYLLASSFAAYLPFPDGASERRGTVLAAMANGLPVISRCGPAVGRLENLFLQAETPAGALEHLLVLQEHPEKAEALRIRGRQFTRQYEWLRIAMQHKQIYQALIESSSKGKRMTQLRQRLCVRDAANQAQVTAPIDFPNNLRASE